eukprot:361114-Chlamydomonas_euryale.AAC.10
MAATAAPCGILAASHYRVAPSEYRGYAAHCRMLWECEKSLHRPTAARAPIYRDAGHGSTVVELACSSSPPLSSTRICVTRLNIWGLEQGGLCHLIAAAAIREAVTTHTPPRCPRGHRRPTRREQSDAARLPPAVMLQSLFTSAPVSSVTCSSLDPAANGRLQLHTVPPAMRQAVAPATPAMQHAATAVAPTTLATPAAAAVR